MADATVMEQIVSLCKRRGFVYPASEIYGGINGFWDYGPLGVLLKNNIRDWWWRCMVECPPIGPDGHPIDMVGIDTAIIQHPKTWEASGHVGGFSDPMVDDKETKQRFRADHLWGVWPAGEGDSPDRIQTIDAVALLGLKNRRPEASFIGSSAAEAMEEFREFAKKIKVNIVEESNVIESGATLSVGFIVTESKRTPGKFSKWAFLALSTAEWQGRYEQIPSPFTGKAGSLTEPRAFNLMFETFVGAIQSEESKAHLRPETAQGIFLNFKNVLDTTRVKVPFGVAQIGKSFATKSRRGILFSGRASSSRWKWNGSARRDESGKWYEFWKAQRMAWWRSLGVAESQPALSRSRKRRAQFLFQNDGGYRISISLHRPGFRRTRRHRPSRRLRSHPARQALRPAARLFRPGIATEAQGRREFPMNRSRHKAGMSPMSSSRPAA
jgi:glycyl-tRNA synthetase